MEKEETRIELKSHDDELVIAPEFDDSKTDYDQMPEGNSIDAESSPQTSSTENDCDINGSTTPNALIDPVSTEPKAAGEGGGGIGRRNVNEKKQEAPPSLVKSDFFQRNERAFTSWWHLVEFCAFGLFACLCLFWLLAVPANLFVITTTGVECDWTPTGIVAALLLYAFAIQLFLWSALSSLPSLSLWLGDIPRAAAIERFRMQSFRIVRAVSGSTLYTPIRFADIENAVGKTEEAEWAYRQVHQTKISLMSMPAYSESLTEDGYARWLEKNGSANERKRWTDLYGAALTCRRAFLIASLALMAFVTPLYVNAVWCFPSVMAYSRFGHYKLAEETFRSGVSTLEQYLGKDNPILLSVVCSVAGQLFYENGDFKKAKPYVDRWLKHVTSSGQLIKLNKEQKAGLYCNKAFCDVRTGDLLSAKYAYDDAAKALGIPDTIDVHNRDFDVFEPLGLLGEIHRLQSQYAIAERKYKRAIQNGQMLPAQNRWWSAMPLNGLAQVYIAQGKIELAQEVYNQLDATIAQKVRTRHPDYELAKICEDYATFLRAHGDKTKANEMFLAAAQIRERLSR